MLIKNCFLMGKNSVEAKQWLDKRYRDSVLGKLTIIDWYAKFKRGRTNTDDAEGSSRSKSAVVPENITKSKCFRSGCRVCSHLTKDNNASRIQSAVWSCSSDVKRIFCGSM